MFVEYGGLWVPVEVVAVIETTAVVNQFGTRRMVGAADLRRREEIPIGSVVV